MKCIEGYYAYKVCHNENKGKDKYLLGWRNQGKNDTAPLNKPYYDTNTALFPSFTLTMHMFAISHCLAID